MAELFDRSSILVQIGSHEVTFVTRYLSLFIPLGKLLLPIRDNQGDRTAHTSSSGERNFDGG